MCTVGCANAEAREVATEENLIAELATEIDDGLNGGAEDRPPVSSDAWTDYRRISKWVSLRKLANERSDMIMYLLRQYQEQNFWRPIVQKELFRDIL
jgi:hypothetical protein